MLKHNGFTHRDRILHVEVLNDETETEAEFLKRVKSLEGKIINVFNPKKYIIDGRSIVLMIGELNGYKKHAKIIIASFDNDKTEDAYMYLLNNIMK